MSHQSDLIAEDIDAYLSEHERKEMLRFITCGSVDDGKSTLIGRLLHDSQMIYEDQLAAIRKDSKRSGTQGGELDLALLVDGLQAEREQGITIDVAYRYFSTPRRKFIIADCPGHEQYTRNMVTGASTCDAAVILIDAAHGVLTQTRRHTFLVSLLGVRHVVVAINKMDLVDFDEARFEQIKADYLSFSSRLDIDDLHFVPISALKGDNVVDPSAQMPWYQGATLMYLLETLHVAGDRKHTDFRFPVQWVNRPDSRFRGYSGSIVSGVVRPGDPIMVLPSRRTSRVERIVTFDGDLDDASTPQAITLTLEDEIDISRGDVIVHQDALPAVRDRFDAMVVWMHDEPLVPGREYRIKHAAQQVRGLISAIRHRIDVNTLELQAAPSLGLNEIGRCELRLARPVALDRYDHNRGMGAFIVIDPLTNLTVGAGMVSDTGDSGPRDAWDTEPGAEHLVPQGAVPRAALAERLRQRAVTVLFTGLTASGKTTIAQAVERALFDAGHLATTIDGQQLRVGISRDLGFTATERSENLRRGIEVARAVNRAGVIALCAFVAPAELPRRRARETVGEDQFLEVFVDAPLDVCRARDQRGLYAAADRGEILDFPGVTAPFEAPSDADLVLDSARDDLATCVQRVMTLLRDREVLGGL
ncbi:MAG: sulfate adenylyltransferase subunit CysN [Pseudomonadales bacterium]|jgi:bifunctional enzyme CysN/CysC|nr:sulfate adenylyltransferase subunit CysN [Pseudomonadales bacterium]